MPQTLVLARSITEANRYAKAVGLPRFSYRAVRNAGAIRGVRHAEVHLLSTFLDRLDRHAIMAALRHARTLEVFYVDVHDFPDLLPGRAPDGEAVLSTYVEDQGDGMGPQITIEEAIAETEALAQQLKDAGVDHPEVNAILEHGALDEIVISPESMAVIREDNPELADAIEQANPELADFSTQYPEGGDPDEGPNPLIKPDPEEPSEPTGAPEPSEEPAPPAEEPTKRRRSRCKDCGSLHFKDEACVPSEPASIGSTLDDFFG